MELWKVHCQKCPWLKCWMIAALNMYHIKVCFTSHSLWNTISFTIPLALLQTSHQFWKETTAVHSSLAHSCPENSLLVRRTHRTNGLHPDLFGCWKTISVNLAEMASTHNIQGAHTDVCCLCLSSFFVRLFEGFYGEKKRQCSNMLIFLFVDVVHTWYTYPVWFNKNTQYHLSQYTILNLCFTKKSSPPKKKTSNTHMFPPFFTPL